MDSPINIQINVSNSLFLNTALANLPGIALSLATLGFGNFVTGYFGGAVDRYLIPTVSDLFYRYIAPNTAASSFQDCVGYFTEKYSNLCPLNPESYEFYNLMLGKVSVGPLNAFLDPITSQLEKFPFCNTPGIRNSLSFAIEKIESVDRVADIAYLVGSILLSSANFYMNYKIFSKTKFWFFSRALQQITLKPNLTVPQWLISASGAPPAA